MKGKLVKDALILTIITLVAGLGLGIVYEITKEPIRKAKEEALQRIQEGDIVKFTTTQEVEKTELV